MAHLDLAKQKANFSVHKSYLFIFIFTETYKVCCVETCKHFFQLLFLTEGHRPTNKYIK